MTPAKTPHRFASRTRAAGATSSRPVLPVGGANARTGPPLASLLRRTGLFARFAREHTPPVSVAAVCMAVYGDTWADLPGALPKYVPASASGSASGRTRGRRTIGP